MTCSNVATACFNLLFQHSLTLFRFLPYFRLVKSLLGCRTLLPRTLLPAVHLRRYTIDSIGLCVVYIYIYGCIDIFISFLSLSLFLSSMTYPSKYPLTNPPRLPASHFYRDFFLFLFLLPWHFRSPTFYRFNKISRILVCLRNRDFLQWSEWTRSKSERTVWEQPSNQFRTLIIGVLCIIPGGVRLSEAQSRRPNELLDSSSYSLNITPLSHLHREFLIFSFLLCIENFVLNYCNQRCEILTSRFPNYTLNPWFLYGVSQTCISPLMVSDNTPKILYFVNIWHTSQTTTSNLLHFSQRNSIKWVYIVYQRLNVT